MAAMAASAPISTTELVSAIIAKPASTRSITKPLCFEKADVTTRACWGQSVSRHCAKRIRSRGGRAVAQALRFEARRTSPSGVRDTDEQDPQLAPPDHAFFFSLSMALSMAP